LRGARRSFRARRVEDQQSALHLAAGAAQRRSCEHAFGRAAAADIDVDAGVLRISRVDDAATSPSPIRRIAAPVARTSSISF
jgi:hypothetical protein